MTDSITKKRRSWNMSRIRSKDTKPEMAVRSSLKRLGVSFRVHVRRLPGCPDIVLSKLRTVLFVNGCFWHRHRNCRFAYCPKTHQDFWEKKFRTNIERDRRLRRSLKKLGWTVQVIWECQTREVDRLDKLVRRALLTQSSEDV
ncbi:MAG: very short patch repair endonuclease [Acidobacteriia bacterium]|nr:very short patch repair endonuclease [Terriglobia bacterium]